MSRIWTEEHWRLFVACPLPPDVERAVAAWQRDELEDHEGLRVSRNPHITLVFLGDVDRRRLPVITAALGEVRFSPITVAFSGPLFLPPRGPARVLALAVDDPSGALTALQGDIARRLAATGVYRPEKRPYLPHVTVARYRRPGERFSLQNVTIPEYCLDRVVLYSSLLERAGAVHTPIADFPAT